mmetsp:Transcript_39119/g.34807  ORF Transcript_39119/g.34807 Transcript_39119/m.34807 type:complete len:81 (+) Transcript_39119:555-797(+)
MTKLLLNKLLDRPLKSAVINMSSQSSFVPLPQYGIYGASKSFNHFFSMSMAQDYGEKIDFLSCRPSYISTGIIKNVPPNF